MKIFWPTTKITFIIPDLTREEFAQEFLIVVLLSKFTIAEGTMTIISGLEMFGPRGQASFGDSSGTDSFDQIRSPKLGWEKPSKSE